MPSADDTLSIRLKNERLQKIKPLTGKVAKDLASWYENPEIPDISKEIPAIFFNLKGVPGIPTDIWIENPKSLDETSQYVHNQLIKKLNKFVGESVQYIFGGNILVDKNGKKYLVLDDTRANNIRNTIEESEKSMKERESFTLLLDVLNKYGISKVIENTENSGEVVGKSMLEKRREDIFLINLARRYKMTNSQYLRLIILAERLLEANAQVSLEKIAEDIVKNPDNENIPISNV